jgi:hypothetical protein
VDGGRVVIASRVRFIEAYVITESEIFIILSDLGLGVIQFAVEDLYFLK